LTQLLLHPADTTIGWNRLIPKKTVYANRINVLSHLLKPL